MMFPVSATIQSSTIVLLALGACALLRKQSAALRHWILAASLSCAVLTPIASAAFPRWHLRLAHDGSRPVRVAPQTGRLTIQLTEPAATSAAVAAPNTPALRFAAPLLAAIWLAGVISGIGVLLSGFVRLRLLQSRSHRVADLRWRDISTEIAHAFGIGRRVTLLESKDAWLVATWGIFRPRIVVPHLARGWCEERVRSVLSHELAHIRRNDWPIQIAADLLTCVYWFNPLMWLAARRLGQESEQACDDAVIRSGIPPGDYALHLIEIARNLAHARHLPAAAIARPSTLERRIAAMLNPAADRGPGSRVGRVAAMVALAAMAVPLAGLKAQTLATVIGTATDQHGGILPNVAITLSEAHGPTKHSTITASSGAFQFVGLAAGEYTLEARLVGFATLNKTLSIGTGETVAQNLVLHVGSIEETITVHEDDAPDVATPPPPPPPPPRPPNDNAPSPTPRAAPQPPAPTTARGGTNRSATPPPPPPPPPPVAPPRPAAAEKPCVASNVGGQIRPPRMLRNTRPQYPTAFRSEEDQAVVLDAIIGVDGFVKQVIPASGIDPALETAAVAAVQQWQFTPAMLNCVPVEVSMKVTVTFSPKQ